MRYFFIFLGICGTVSLITVVGILLIGVPSNSQEVTKVIEIKHDS